MLCSFLNFVDSAVIDSGSVSNVTSESIPSTPNSLQSETNHSGNKSLLSLSSCYSTPGNSSLYSVHCKRKYLYTVFSYCC